MRSRAVLALAALLPACAAFPDHSPDQDRAMAREVAAPGGAVRVDATFELRHNGELRKGRDGQYDRNLERMTEAYRTAGLFDRVADPRERPTTVAIVRGRALVEGNRAWQVASLLTLFLVPSSVRVAFDVDTILLDAATQREIGRSSVCRSFRESTSLFLLPAAIAGNSVSEAERETVVGATQLGLALALAGDDRSPALAAAAEGACPGTAQLARPRVPTRDPRGSWEAVSARREEGPCLERPGVRKYLTEVEVKVRERWTPLRGAPETPPASVLLDFTPDGFVEAASPEIEAGDPVVAQRTLEAVHAAMPFPPLEGTLACLADEAVPLRFAE